MTPSMTSVYGYWNASDGNLFDSYRDYVRETGLAKYNADVVGKYIATASAEHVEAIGRLGQAMGRGMNVLSDQMSDISNQLGFLNKNLDLQIENQKLSNLLLQNISELLRVPDSEKERQRSIELGIKFFVNASKDSDLYADALEELEKAESMMKQDYFVLHRIGCIYLYVEKFLNPEKALEYFLKAAKYASVESDPSAYRLANVLTQHSNSPNNKKENYEKQIGMLAADSYEKAAFSCYILGKFDDATNYQTKALKLNPSLQYRFQLAKYQARAGKVIDAVDSLNHCIEANPIFASAVFREFDLINEKEVINLISNKNSAIDIQISNLISQLVSANSERAKIIINELTELSRTAYESKVSKFKTYTNELLDINTKFEHLKSEVDDLTEVISNTSFRSLDAIAKQSLLDELIMAKKLSMEDLGRILLQVKNRVKVARDINNSFRETEIKIDALIQRVQNTAFLTMQDKNIESIIGNLRKAKDLPLDKMIEVLNEATRITYEDQVKIGSKYAGGVVFYIDEEGRHGLVCALKDFGFSAWGKKGRIIGASGDGVGDGSGKLNTSKIAEQQCENAGRLCIQSKHNGYSDWYLPNIEEWRLIHHNLRSEMGALFYVGKYWSSKELNADKAWIYKIDNEPMMRIHSNYGSDIDEKYMTHHIRAIRAF